MSYLSPVFNVRTYGAKGNGTDDDYTAISQALAAAKLANGCLYFPKGLYRINTALAFTNSTDSISIKGDGPNSSILVAGNGNNALNLNFNQSLATQPYTVVIEDLGFKAIGAAGTAIIISVNPGSPDATEDHYRPTVVARNIIISSDGTTSSGNSWAHGVDITSAWNVCMTDCFISGPGVPNTSDWSPLRGNGIALHRSCVNSHFVNCHCNFWANGFYYDTGSGQSDPNTEGIFFSNCSFVAVKKGAFITGNPNYITGGISVPRVDNISWAGGLIELRAKGVTSGSAAFHLVHVWDVEISTAMFVTDTTETQPTTYAAFLDNCIGIVFADCSISAFRIGLATVNTCGAVNHHGHSFTSCPTQTSFSSGTTRSRSYGHVLTNGSASEIDNNGTNLIGWV